MGKHIIIFIILANFISLKAGEEWNIYGDWYLLNTFRKKSIKFIAITKSGSLKDVKSFFCYFDDKARVNLNRLYDDTDIYSNQCRKYKIRIINKTKFVAIPETIKSADSWRKVAISRIVFNIKEITKYDRKYYDRKDSLRKLDIFIHFSRGSISGKLMQSAKLKQKLSNYIINVVRGKHRKKSVIDLLSNKNLIGKIFDVKGRIITVLNNVKNLKIGDKVKIKINNSKIVKGKVIKIYHTKVIIKVKKRRLKKGMLIYK